MQLHKISPVLEENQPFEAILWDMDGTLADSEPVHELSFHLACRELGIDLPDNFHETLLGQSDTETFVRLRQDFGLALSLPDWMALRFKVFMDHIDRVTIMQEAQALWDQAQSRGIPQAIVSNSDRLIVGATLDRLGLARPGMISVTRNDVRQGKPHPDPYLRAAKLLDVNPAEVAVVEDSATGARSGVAAGMRVFMMSHFDGDMVDGMGPSQDLTALLA